MSNEFHEERVLKLEKIVKLISERNPYEELYGNEICHYCSAFMEDDHEEYCIYIKSKKLTEEAKS